MAHIGNIWPLAFRRDFNLNVTTNRFGWAKTYTGFLDLQAAGFGAVIAGQAFTPGPEFYPQFDEIAWESPLIRLGLFFYRTTLLCEIIGRGKYFRQIIVNVQGHGDILVCNWPTGIDENQPGWPIGRVLNVVFFSTDWFDFMPTGVTSGYRPFDWRDINGP